MAGSMRRYVEVVKHYPGQQQVDLSVEIEVPGSWFGGTEMGSLTASERRQKYKAQAVEYAEVREFPGASRGARKVKEAGIRFICIDDAASDPNSEGYWMKLSQWNRFRHDTFKERPDDEQPFILGTDRSDAGGATDKPEQTQTSGIKQVFKFVGAGVHVQKDKTEVPCQYWACTQKNCKLHGQPIKELRKGTGLLFRHLSTCNKDLWRTLRLKSKHSKAYLDEEGEEIEVSLERCGPTCTIVPISH